MKHICFFFLYVHLQPINFFTSPNQDGRHSQITLENTQMAINQSILNPVLKLSIVLAESHLQNYSPSATRARSLL